MLQPLNAIIFKTGVILLSVLTHGLINWKVRLFIALSEKNP